MASRGRPKKQLTYDRAAVKRLNERFRKIQKEYGTGYQDTIRVCKIV